MKKLILKNRDIEITEEELADLNKQASEKKSIWPECTAYYYVHDSNIVEESFWTNSDYERTRFLMGNYFINEEDAEKYRDYLIALQSVRQFILEEGLDFRPDWYDKKQDKYTISYWDDNDDFEINCWNSKNSLSILGHFKSEEECEKLISAKEAELRIIFTYQKPIYA
jgi:hypothetical protein